MTASSPMMTLEEAIEWVEQGRAERIAAPGQWKVWRTKDSSGADQVKYEVTP